MKTENLFFVLILAVLILTPAATDSAALAASPESSEVRASFHKLLDRPKVPLAATTIPQGGDGQVSLEWGSFESEANQTVPFLIVKPARAEGRFSAVIALHGTGDDKDAMLDLCAALAERGMLAIAMDARYHGSRVPGGANGSEQYQDAILRAWQEKDATKQEHPLYFDTVYDVWRAVDYLQSRADVDPQRIGMIGISMGGIETWLAAATDERIQVAVPMISVQSFQWSLEHEQWQGRAATIQRALDAAAKELGETSVNAKAVRAFWNKLLPGILEDFDCPTMLRAIAPRPLLILSGETDPGNPLEGAKLAFAAAEEAYKSANAGDRLQMDVAEGVGHSVTEEQVQLALDWLERWLKP